MQTQTQTQKSCADLRLQNGMTDKIAKLLGVDANDVELHIGRYYYNRAKCYDVEHLRIPICVNDKKIGIYEISLYTGIVQCLTFYTRDVLEVAPLTIMEELRTWALEQEGEMSYPDVYFISRAICLREPLRTNIADFMVPIQDPTEVGV